MGGYVADGGSCRPWRACAAGDVAAGTASSDTYNADTPRVVVMFLSNDGSVGGFGLAAPGDAP